MRTSNLVVVCTSLLLAALLFWPTLYRYDKEEDLSALVRTNRVTGTTAVLLGGSWIPIKTSSASPAPPTVELPDSELAKITGNAIISGGTFSGRIYNGSSWRVERVYLVVTAKELNGKVRWRREVTTRLDADALETTFFSLSVTGDQGIGSTEWSIERAFGRKSDAIVPRRNDHQVQGPWTRF